MIQTREAVKNTPLAILGEGSLWHPIEKVLYWVDISGMKLFRYDPLTEQCRTFMTGSMIGTVVPAAHTYAVVVALETGIYGMDDEGSLYKLADYPVGELQNNRFNDGKCDPAGRLWVGTMNKEVHTAAGNLYCWQDKEWCVKQSGVTISNGPAWALCEKIMYHTDTADYAICAYDYNLKNGHICNRRMVIEVARHLGAPDGMTIDDEGMLWVAHWGGNAVIRWNPLTGQLMEKIEVPAPHVTSCAFGDKHLQTLYITTAREGLSEEQLLKYPLSGALFKIQTNAKGVSAALWRAGSK